MRFRAGLSLVALALLSGCAGDGDETTTVTVRETVTQTGATTVPGDEPVVLKVYLLDEDEKVAPVPRPVVSGPAVARAALTQLLRGAAGEELATAIPRETELGGISVAGGVADVELSRTLPAAAQAQVVYTLTQFPTVERVRFLVEGQAQGAAVGRARFEQQTPAVLVESPLPGETVEPGFAVTGTANTFEATFQYELKDSGGRVISDDFVTATSGSGTRGTFRFSVPYEVSAAQDGTLVVFEISAANGSRVNEREIPLRLE